MFHSPSPFGNLLGSGRSPAGGSGAEPPNIDIYILNISMKIWHDLPPIVQNSIYYASIIHSGLF